MWSKAFWAAAGERAVKTFAQTLVIVMTADGVGLLDADWVARLSAAAGAAVLSLLTSIASDKVGQPGPSLTTETTDPVDAVEEPSTQQWLDGGNPPAGPDYPVA